MSHFYVTAANKVKLHPGMLWCQWVLPTERHVLTRSKRVEVSPIKQRNFTTKLSRMIKTASYAT